jgi:single-strand DNA-binding protein
MQINSFTATGRLGQDPDVKYFESGSVVAKASIAIDKNTSKKDDPPSWFRLECWGKTAEIFANYCKKGSQVGVSGSIYPETWTDKTSGETKIQMTVKVEQITLLDKKGEGGSTQSATPSAGASTDYYEDF